MSALQNVLAPSGRAGGIILLASLILLMAACGAKEGGNRGAGPGAGGMPPPEVGVVTVAEQPVALQVELPGRIEALAERSFSSRSFSTETWNLWAMEKTVSPWATT